VKRLDPRILGAMGITEMIGVVEALLALGVAAAVAMIVP
jgi:hypothetical protein